MFQTETRLQGEKRTDSRPSCREGEKGARGHRGDKRGGRRRARRPRGCRLWHGPLGGRVVKWGRGSRGTSASLDTRRWAGVYTEEFFRAPWSSPEGKATACVLLRGMSRHWIGGPRKTAGCRGGGGAKDFAPDPPNPHPMPGMTPQ